MDCVVRVYVFTAQLPADERYNLTSQLRRAATSVPLNIAEGCGCATKRELVRFLGYSYRSLKELATCLELCARLYRTSEPAVVPLIDEADQLARMVRGFMRRLEVTAVAARTAASTVADDSAVASVVADHSAVAAAVAEDSLKTQNS